MRKISAAQVAVFVLMISATLALSIVCVRLAYPALAPAGEFRAIVALVLAAILFLAFSIAAYRSYLGLFPLPAGPIAKGSPAEFRYHVYLLFFLLVYYPLMKSNLLPVPALRLLYLALGARLGDNTYSAGILFDPLFVRIGSNTIVGQGALLIPHAIEGEHLSHAPIHIGSNVTIGANAVILSDVEIGDRAIVAIGAVVVKGTRIGDNEVWGGIPARRLDGRNQSQGTE